MALGSTQPLTEMSTRGISWGIKAAGAWGWPYHHPVLLSWNLGTLTSWNPLGLSKPVTGPLYLTYLDQRDKDYMRKDVTVAKLDVLVDRRVWEKDREIVTNIETGLNPGPPRKSGKHSDQIFGILKNRHAVFKVGLTDTRIAIIKKGASHLFANSK